MDSDVPLLFQDFLEPVSYQNNTRYAGILRPMIRMINDSSLIYTVLCHTLSVKVRCIKTQRMMINSLVTSNCVYYSILKQGA